MNKSRALSLGITSAIVMLCGGGMSALTYFIQKTLVEGSNADEETWKYIKDPLFPPWIVGIVVTVPGLLGLTAGCCQNKCLYVLSSIISLICLIILGLVFFIFGLVMVLLIFSMTAIKELCVDDRDGCKCRNSTSNEEYKDTGYRTCEYLTTMVGLCIGLLIVAVVAWVFLLVVFVLSCVYACRSNRETSGTVFVPAQQPMLPPEYPPQYQKQC